MVGHPTSPERSREHNGMHTVAEGRHVRLIRSDSGILNRSDTNRVKKRAEARKATAKGWDSAEGDLLDPRIK